MLTHSHSRSSRAALMATLTKIIIVLVQLSLAVTFFHKAEDAFERQSVPCIATVRAGGGTDAADATDARRDPKWLALARVPLPPLLPPLLSPLLSPRLWATSEGTACS